MATPSTTARFLAERISRILPDLPLWAPAMTTTTSFFLMWNFWDMLEDLRREGDDLRVVLAAELAGDGPEDAGALRVAVLADDDDGVGIETEVAAVGPAQRGAGADDHGLHDLALLHGGVGAALLDVDGDDVADVGVAGGMPDLADHRRAARAGVIGNIKDGTHLDHGRSLRRRVRPWRRPWRWPWWSWSGRPRRRPSRTRRRC